MKYAIIRITFAAFLCTTLSQTQLQAQAGSSEITVHINQTKGPLRPIWAWFGYDEPNYTYMKDGRKLLTEISALSPVPVYVRAHSLLSSGDGVAALKWGSTNAYTEDSNGKPIYSWSIIDSIFDTYVKRGMKPLAQIGFMPEALSIKPQPYRHYWKPGDPYSDIITGWAYPPKDYNKWAELVYQWVRHSVERYGQKEVESWYWEVWNEPDQVYWKGTKEEFFKLYDYSAMAVKKALPTARIGGANVTGGATKFLDDFINHCLTGTNYATGKMGSPLDLVLFHAKGSPKLDSGIVQMGIRNQLKNIENNFKVIASHPELKDIPVVIGESDPEGCAACGMNTDPQNAYRNGTMYSSYTAASFARKYELLSKYGINLIGAVTWAFEFENQPWFYGFRDLSTNGVDKPVLNVFRMFGKMKGNMVKAEADDMYPLQTVLDSGIRKGSDIGVLAAADQESATAMVWNYHDRDKRKDQRKVAVTFEGISAAYVTVIQYRVDQQHSNSYTLWQKMGSPQKPDATQVAALQKAGMLQINTKPIKQKTVNGKLTIPLSLPAQAVTLLELKW
jgi:xylan 1,4-beta-xylosidase